MSRHEFGWLNPRESHCEGKEAFDTSKLANTVADRRTYGKSTRKLRPYRCQTCGKWHLSSVRKGHPPVGIHRRPRLEQEESTF
jgi:hypothetical protein